MMSLPGIAKPSLPSGLFTSTPTRFKTERTYFEYAVSYITDQPYSLVSLCIIHTYITSPHPSSQENPYICFRLYPWERALPQPLDALILLLLAILTHSEGRKTTTIHKNAVLAELKK